MRFARAALTRLLRAAMRVAADIFAPPRLRVNNIFFLFARWFRHGRSLAFR
jgi:hypothetical protein